jgi:hypothetical protein
MGKTRVMTNPNDGMKYGVPGMDEAGRYVGKADAQESVV